MRWYSKLYVSDSAGKKKEKLISMVEAGERSGKVFLLIIPAYSPNQMEIITSKDLKFWTELQPDPMIIGIACSKQEALELVRQITEDVLKQTGSVQMREFFERG